MTDLGFNDPSQDSEVWELTRAERADENAWELRVEGEVAHRAPFRPAMLNLVIQNLNRLVASTWTGAVCHAGAVAHEGNGVLFPADPESGKTTLTCGLVRAGFSYLSDEAVAFRPGTSVIEPYPKPLSLDRGSWFLFPDLESQSMVGLDSEGHEAAAVAGPSFGDST